MGVFVFQKLIRNRQKPFIQGDLMAFRKLRNQVNRERKKLRAKYYDTKIKQLGSCALATWSKEIKMVSLNILVGMIIPCPCLVILSVIQIQTPPAKQNWPMKSIKLFLDPWQTLHHCKETRP